ncbi:MAG: hypothetical protein SV487_03870 [Thermodesulfobacteriota bacterium]|nr:hypothetical protein [Thermodesulfobacteriota bacterium]
MVVKQNHAVEVMVKDDPPSCFQECIWYEPGEEDNSCLNRHDFVCEKHRNEVFGNGD